MRVMSWTPLPPWFSGRASMSIGRVRREKFSILLVISFRSETESGYM